MTLSLISLYIFALTITADAASDTFDSHFLRSTSMKKKKKSHRRVVSHPWKNETSSPFRNGVYTGPFTKLSDNDLNVADPANGFGPEDKLIQCTLSGENLLVFIDLDESAKVYTYSFATAMWTNAEITMDNPPCATGQLYPRDSGFVVGLTVNPSGLDRLIIIGGSDNENNIYFSDDCGLNWMCESSTDWPFDPRDYAPIVHTDSIFPGDPVIFAGGIVDIGLPTSGMFQSFDSGMNWSRPVCESSSGCNDNLPEPDPVGTCNDDVNPNNWQMCYMLPDVPLFPGAIATDWDNLWMWLEPDDDGILWRLGSDNYGTTGWEQSSARWGGFGRKVFIKGTNPGAGCWFSTDFLAEDMWVFPNGQVASMNNFMTAKSAEGPWTDFTGIKTAPWAPRASAAITSSFRSTSAFLASGLTWKIGDVQPSSPTFGDVWMIDAGVCLLASGNGLPCGGIVDPNLDSVTCNCPTNFQGDDVCGSCTAGIAFGWPNCQACPVSNGACNSGAGKGTCNQTQGCVCNVGWTNGCVDCSIGYFGPECQACDSCSLTGGTCSGSGTHSGSGNCICNVGFTGDSCSDCDDSHHGINCSPCAQCSSIGGTCNGAGSHGGDGSCNCKVGFSGNDCSLCDTGYFGSTCSACNVCDSNGGTCDGSGTNSGTGTCICKPDYTGSDCSQIIPANNAANTSAQNAGVAAGISIGVIAAAGSALFVYITYFGGGPTVNKALTSLRMSVSGSGRGSSSNVGERASILRSTAPVLRAPESYSNQTKPLVLDKASAAARFSSL